jgi:hypothetical protein
MKADLQLKSTPAVGNTVLRLALVGTILLGCGYGVLTLCASALQLLP